MRSKVILLQAKDETKGKFGASGRFLSATFADLPGPELHWEQMPSAPVARLDGAAIQIKNILYVFAGYGNINLVELLIPQLQFLDDEGAQAELWELSRIFIDTLIKETGCQKVKAIFPDTGAAALLKYQWKDAIFGFSSLSGRKPVEDEDEIIVMPRPLIMWNPRLVSEDVGVGFNFRKLRRSFLRNTNIRKPSSIGDMPPLSTIAAGLIFSSFWRFLVIGSNSLLEYID